jgi:oligoribonuclease NrnB/cAMP/cGMP phosphodiesterase (DHH superfamily)
MFPWKHNKDLRTCVVDTDKWDDIYIVDLAPPLTWIRDLLLNGFRVVIVDHHATSVHTYEDVVEDNLTLCIEEGKSATQLAWELLYGDTKPMPWVAQMISDWDIWNHEDPQVIPFHFGMECLDKNEAKLWTALFKGDPSACMNIMQMGQLIGAYWYNNMNEITSSHSYTITKDDKKFIVCNGWFLSSYDFAASFDEEKLDAMMWFRFVPTSTDKPWWVSFRTTKDGMDMSKIVEPYGGSGHKQTASCNMTHEELREWLPVEPVINKDGNKLPENN